MDDEAYFDFTNLISLSSSLFSASQTATRSLFGGVHQHWQIVYELFCLVAFLGRIVGLF